MLRALALASLLHLAPAPVASVNETTPLERLARESDRILLASVLSVKTLEQRDEPVLRDWWPAHVLPIAELEVERTLVGPRGEGRVFVLAARPVAGKLEQVLKRGERAIVFLERDELFERHASERTRAELATHCKGAFLRSIQPGGLWKLDADGNCAAPSEAAPLPPELEPYAARGIVPSLRVLDWTARRVAAELPWVEMRFVGLGLPDPLRVDARRQVFIDSDTVPRRRLTETEWQGLWTLIAEADVFELPLEMGSSRGPCASHTGIRIRTREGGWSGYVNFDVASTPMERSQLERVKPVCDALAKLRKSP